MKKYTIKYYDTQCAYIDIDADSLEDAERKAGEMLDNGELSLFEHNTYCTDYGVEVLDDYDERKDETETQGEQG